MSPRQTDSLEKKKAVGRETHGRTKKVKKTHLVTSCFKGKSDKKNCVSHRRKGKKQGGEGTTKGCGPEAEDAVATKTKRPSHGRVRPFGEVGPKNDPSMGFLQKKTPAK